MANPSDVTFSEADVAALREALTPEVREALAGTPGGEMLNPLLMSLEGVLEADDPQRALADLVGRVQLSEEDAAEAVQFAQQLAESYGPVAHKMQATLGKLAERMGQIAADHDDAKQAMHEAGQTLGGRASELVDQAMDLLTKSVVGDRLRQLVGDTQQVAAGVERLMGDATGLWNDDPKAAQRMADQVRDLEGRVQQAASLDWLVDLLPILRELADLAQRDGHPEVARLRLIVAALTEVAGLQGDGVPADIDSLYAKALHEAETHRDPSVAKRAATRMQAAAMDARDFETVADLAIRVADVAKRDKQVGLEIMCRCEAAVAWSAGGLHDRALDLAQRTVHRALQAGTLVPRAQLTLAQVLEAAGRVDEARRQYEAVLPLAREAGADVELGRAAMGVAQCLPKGQDDERRQAALEVAREVGMAKRDPGLIVRASVVLADMHLDRGDKRATIETLARARAAAMRLAGDVYTQPLSRYLDVCIDTWGEAAVRDELMAYQERK